MVVEDMEPHNEGSRSISAKKVEIGSSSSTTASSRARMTEEWRYPVAGCPSTTGKSISTITEAEAS